VDVPEHGRPHSIMSGIAAERGHYLVRGFAFWPLR
jgi:hypothetical protein